MAISKTSVFSFSEKILPQIGQNCVDELLNTGIPPHLILLLYRLCYLPLKKNKIPSEIQFPDHSVCQNISFFLQFILLTL